MSDQEQWTAGTTPSDAKLGTDDPAEEAEQQVQPPGSPVADEPKRADAEDDRNP